MDEGFLTLQVITFSVATCRCEQTLGLGELHTNKATPTHFPVEEVNIFELIPNVCLG